MLVYLASPYSHKDPAVRQRRFDAACKAAANLINQGVHVFSPIAHSHPIAQAGGLDTSWDFWQTYDRIMIEASDSVVVLMLEDWHKSLGVKSEIAIAEELGKIVEYMSPV